MTHWTFYDQWVIYERGRAVNNKDETMHGRSNTEESPPWAPFEDRRRARDEKRDAVLRMAVQMFLDEGYHRATLNEVAARLNITKPALYNYFRSKEDILIECYRLGQDMFEASIAAIERESGDGLDKLRALIRAYAGVMMTDFGMCLVRLDDRELSAEARARVRKAKRAYDAAFRTTIAQGVADGSITSRDPRLATLVITGSLNWIGQWYRPDRELSPLAIADEFALRLTEGFAARKSRSRKN
jgi:AcrR family transcriptional regulator